MRANDKIVRLQSAARGSTLKNEGIEDSLLDIATYSIIAVCLFRRGINGYWDQDEEPTSTIDKVEGLHKAITKLVSGYND